MKTEHARDAGPIDDDALIAAAQHDRSAFGSIYERYVDEIYRYVYHRVGNHVDAEDLTAATFQRAQATLSGFEPGRAPLGTWLRDIAGNLIAQRNQTGERPGAEIDNPADSGNSDLLAALRLLPLAEQRAIVLKFARGRSSREIGEALNLDEDAAKQLIYRALVTLHTALESE